jgi:hypothetical protein
VTRAPAWIAVLLVALPVLVYWPTVFHEFGFRDDYAHLREVRERPGWLTRLTTSNGRPVYGAVLEASLRPIAQVADLPALRLVGVVFVALTGVLLWLYLRRAGWSEVEAAAYGALVTLLPGAQVIAGWAIAWPIALGLMLAVAGFALVDAGLAQQGRRRASRIVAGAALYFTAGLTYQTSALFVIGPLAATLLVRRERKLVDDVRWVVSHVATLFAALVVGVLLMRIVFAEGIVPEALRMQLEPEPLAKLSWFLRQPLPNALTLFASRDRLVEYAGFWIVFAAMLGIVLLGFFCGATTRQKRWRWLACALVLPFVAHSVSLAASSQAIGYRTLLPLSAVTLALVVFALRSVAVYARWGRAVELGAFAALVAVAAVVARYQSWELIAVPQGREWQIVKSAVEEFDFKERTRVYVIRPSLGDRSTERVYSDEFGSLSADAAWAAEEMVKAAVRQRRSVEKTAGPGYTVTTGFYEPLFQSDFDLVIDMRTLHSMGDRTTPGGCPPIWQC